MDRRHCCPPLRQHVEEKTTKELHAREVLGVRSTPVGVVLVAKRHSGIVDVKDAVVGDSDAVRVAGQVRNNGSWPREGRSCIDDPLLLPERTKKPTEGCGVLEMRDRSVEGKPSRPKRLFETIEELATEDRCDNPGGNEIVFAARNPARTIERRGFRANFPLLSLRRCGSGVACAGYSVR